MRSVLMLRALGDYGRLMVFPSQLHIERTVFEPALGRSQTSWRNAVATEYLSIGGLLVLGTLLLWRVLEGRWPASPLVRRELVSRYLSAGVESFHS